MEVLLGGSAPRDKPRMSARCSAVRSGVSMRGLTFELSRPWRQTPTGRGRTISTTAWSGQAVAAVAGRRLFSRKYRSMDATACCLSSLVSSMAMKRCVWVGFRYGAKCRGACSVRPNVRAKPTAEAGRLGRAAHDRQRRCEPKTERRSGSAP